MNITNDLKPYREAVDGELRSVPDGRDMPRKIDHSERKSDHLTISLEKDVSFSELSTGLENFRFLHRALPEADYSSIALSTPLFGKELSAPLFISSMVGGIPEAAEINKTLARAAREYGIAMGVGSQRCAVEDPDKAETFRVRDIAPDILLFANIGAVQLNYGFGPGECRKAVDMIEADGLILHLNPLQEALQDEGNTNFKNLLEKIERVCAALSTPVIVKEVGWGISGDVARLLCDAGVAGIDTAGSGGTSWSEVESYRTGNIQKKAMARTFASWGIPLTESITAVRNSVPDIPVIASGGITNGLEAAKAIALGADIAGIGLPFLKAAVQSEKKLHADIALIIAELKLAMFCTGAQDISSLRNSLSLERISRVTQ